MENIYTIKESLIYSTLYVQTPAEYLSTQVFHQFPIPRFWS